MSANDIQVGGDHYKKEGQHLQHWDVVKLMNWDYFQGNITKYVDRHRKKNGEQDLRKALHYLLKYLESEYGVFLNISEIKSADVTMKRSSSTEEQRRKWREQKRLKRREHTPRNAKPRRAR